MVGFQRWQFGGACTARTTSAIPVQITGVDSCMPSRPCVTVGLFVFVSSIVKFHFQTWTVVC